MSKNKLRVSYSLLNAWEKGKTDDAVALYCHLPSMVNKAMLDGRAIHEEVSRLLKDNKTPKWMNNIKFKNPKSELKMIVPYNELFDISAIFDILDEPLLYEIKTGGTSSMDWLGEMQIPMYFLVAEIAKIKIDSAHLIHYNQKTNETDLAIYHNSKFVRDTARNWIDSLAYEIYEFFSKEGLI